MKFKKNLSVLLCILLAAFCFAGCNGVDDYPVNVGGAEITKAPQKVVAFSEQAASAIFALGYDSYLVGAPTEFFKTEMPNITDIGYTRFIDFETVYELKPDVIIVPGQLEGSYLESMKLRDISVVLLETPTNYSEIGPYYMALSKLFLGNNDYSGAYDACYGEMTRVVKSLKALNNDVDKKVAVFAEPDFPITGDTMGGQILNEIGLKNIGQNFKNYMMGYDEIVAANPDVIFCNIGDSEAILTKESYKDITAIKNAAVYEIDVPALVFAGEGFTAVIQDMTTYLSKVK